jgi:hypothetical protein
MRPILPGAPARSAFIGYSFWRDLGYAIGALAAGLLAAIMGLARTIAAIGALTLVSGVLVAGRCESSRDNREARNDKFT